MADEDLLPFDPTMKKKKKKKKTGFDLDAAMGEDTGNVATDGQPTPAPPAEEEPEEELQEKAVVQDKIADDFSMDFTQMKKKKKKKKPVDLGDLGDALPDGDGDTKTDEGMDTLDDGGIEMSDRVDGLAKDGGNSWIGSDRDYTYDELLKRVFDIMREKNPNMIAGEKKKFVMRPPQVLKVGTKKTSIANFADICRVLHRQPKHVLSFLEAEVGNSGSIDGNNQLIIRGKYTQKQIENVLRRYIKEYVTCHTCRSRDTLLQKDTRLFFLQCETCGSRCSVTSIKTGFQAVTGKRAAIRAKKA